MQGRVLAGLAVLVALATAAPQPVEAQGRRWGEGYFPNLPVVTQDGKTLRFYDDLIKGKIVVISFIFTRCTDICPITTSRLAQVEEKLGESVGRDVFIYSITVDPENDSPNRLKTYAEAFQAGPGWLFLTGKLADIREINGKLGERMRSLTEHRNEIVLGNDTTGEWQRDNVFGDLGRVVTSIRSMDPKWREQVRTPPKENATMGPVPLAGPPGQALFVKLCAGCHTVGKGDRVGPDLNGVTGRHARTWLSKYLMDPEKMQAQKDPAALALAAKYPSVRMPNMGLSENDAADLIAYVELQMYRLSSTQGDSQDPPAAPQLHQHHH
jgi:cytochrome oxidase Cu insertion factor (SCO1/SenC/PrrC family)/cytochrome c2